MSLNVMKHALEALEDATKHIFLGDKNGVEANIRAHKQCESLRQAIAEAEKQEPVIGTKTWFDGDKVITQHLHPSDIYKDPQPKAEKQEPICVAFVRQLVSIDKNGIETWKDEPLYITPPKREPLTDEYLEELMMNYGYDADDEGMKEMLRDIEAKLRSKNEY